MIVLRSGAEIPLFPLGVAERLVLFDAAIDVSDKPARRSQYVFAAVGLAWEAAARAEARVPAADRSVPPPPFRPWSTYDGDVYAYGVNVVEALASEDIMRLRSVGDEIAQGAWNSLIPSPAKVEAARKNSEPEGAISPASSGQPAASSGTPSPPST